MRIIKVLDGPVAKYIPATGAMLIARSAEAFYETLVNPSHEPDQRVDRIVFLHEVIHHLQVLSSFYLWQDAVARVELSRVLLHPPDAEARTTAALELTRRERAWGYRAFGVSVSDLCEGAAVLESYKALKIEPNADEFLRWRDHEFPGKGNSPYRRTFDILADECGKVAAFDLLPVVTFLALQGDIPGRSFEILISHPGIASGSLVGAPAWEIIEELGFPPPFFAGLTSETLGALHPKHCHPTLYPVLIEACRSLGDGALETLARPHGTLLSMDESILPPMIIGAHRQGGTISVAFGAAAASNELRLKIHLYTAMVAAARKIITGIAEFIPCPHPGCPNHSAGLCAGWFVPPPEPDICRFRTEMRTIGGKELHQIAAECLPITENAAILKLRSSTDCAEIFPGAEVMPEVVDDEGETCAGRFDQRHLLDVEDNDSLLPLACPACKVIWEEWASQRKINEGFMARCPNCGKLQQISKSRLTIIPM